MTDSDALFIADWTDVLFVHYRVDADRLQRSIPLPLDLLDSNAYISLVAFTQRNLRPTVGGRIAAALLAPLATHEFLNVRTYVRLGDQRGIYFIAEWLPNVLAAFLGPRTYGLPYRLGHLRYGGMRREIDAEGRSLRLETTKLTIESSPLDAFLLERYTAFTHRQGVVRRFDVDHIPWPARRVTVSVVDRAFLSLSGDWSRDAVLIGANYSTGVSNVRISRPRKVQTYCFATPAASATIDQ